MFVPCMGGDSDTLYSTPNAYQASNPFAYENGSENGDLTTFFVKRR